MKTKSDLDRMGCCPQETGGRTLVRVSNGDGLVFLIPSCSFLL